MTQKELVLMVFTLSVCTAFGLSVAFGQEHRHSSYTNWFTSQVQEWNPAKPLCCGDLETRGGDAIFTEVKSDENNGYLVKVDGNWVVYPHPVSPYMGNPTGQNVLWYKRADGGYIFYCLRLALGT